MSDLALSVTLTRSYLGLGDLNINDGVRYKAQPQLLGGQVSWDRNQVTSAYIDGASTVSRVRQMVQEPIGVEVWGRLTATGVMTNTQLQANMGELVDAFSQDSFTITLVVDGATYQYTGEAADYQLSFTGPRFMAKRGAVTFTMPRQPVPLAGTV